MKIALIQANVGGIDEVKKIPEQSVPYDYFLYTENNLPFPLNGLDNRMKAKYIKLQPHHFLSHDVFIYIDGRAEITSPDFIKNIIAPLETHDIVVTKHDQRNTLAEEYDFILKLMSEGNKYLLERYSKEAIEKEKSLSHDDNNTPLYACGVFAWKCTDEMETFFNDWWESCIEWSAYDQGWFTRLCQGYNLNVATINYDMIKIGKHKPKVGIVRLS